MDAGKEKKAKAAILDLLRKLSKEQMMTIQPSLIIGRVEKGRDLSSDHWVSSTLITTPKVSLCFRVHFSSDVGKQLVIDTLGDESEIPSLDDIKDYFKEFCNIVVGRAKTFITDGDDLDNEQKHQTWLPEVNPAFDEFGVVAEGKSEPQDHLWWKISWNDSEIVLYAKVIALENFSLESLKNIDDNPIISVDDEGSVEYF